MAGLDVTVPSSSSSLPISRVRGNSFRVGVLRPRPGSSEYKPVATLGLARDGGIFVAPAAVHAQGWTYGRLRANTAPEDGAHVRTACRPKLHYHRSGIASVSLTGSSLERRTVQLPPLPTVSFAQVFSIVSQNPGDLATADSDRRGDVMAVASQWPTTFALSLWVVAGRGAYEDDTFASEISPLGLASRPYKHFLVSLRGYGREAVLVGRFSLTFEQSSGRGTAVTALRWNPGDPEPATPALGMWSSSVDNPLVFWDQMPTEH